MAIENAKILNVRIRNKYDNYENWVNSDLVLEPGEIAIAYTTVDVKVGEGTAKHPALLMKVGNGSDTFANLPWLSAKAADVLTACKSEEALKTFVNNVIADAGIATDESLTALAGRVTTAEGAITTLNNLVGITAVSQQINDAIAALNLANTYEAKGEAAKVDAKLTTEVARAKEAEEANAAAAKQAQDEVDALELVVDALADTVDTKAAQADLTALAGKVGEVPTDKTVMGIINEIQENAYDDTQLRADMATELDKKADKTQVATDIADAVKVETDARVLAVQGVQDEVDALEQEHAKDKAALENSIKAITDDYLKEEDKTELQNNIDGVNGKVTTLIGEDANKSVRTIANEELAKQLIAEGAAESLDTLIEIAQWIQDHPDDAAAMNKAIEDLTALVGTLPEGVTATTVVGLIQELVKAEEDRAKVAEKANADAIKALQEATAEDGTITAAIKAAQDKADANEAAIAVLNGADTEDGSVAKAVKEAKEAAATDATNKANAAEEAAKGHADDAIAALLAEDGQVGKNAADIVALKETVNKLDGAEDVEGSLLNLIKNAKAEAATDATNKADKALEDAKSHVAGVLAGLKGSVSVSSNRHVLTGVTEAGGKLTDKAEVELSNIAFEGTTDYLEQGTKTLVFDCGSSTSTI